MTLPSIPDENDPERQCAFCLELIEPRDWEDRHSIGVAAAHRVCCMARGCEEGEAPLRLPLSMRNARAC